MAARHQALFARRADRQDARVSVERSGLSLKQARVLRDGFPADEQRPLCGSTQKARAAVAALGER